MTPLDFRRPTKVAICCCVPCESAGSNPSFSLELAAVLSEQALEPGEVEVDRRVDGSEHPGLGLQRLVAGPPRLLARERLADEGRGEGRRATRVEAETPPVRRLLGCALHGGGRADRHDLGAGHESGEHPGAPRGTRGHVDDHERLLRDHRDRVSSLGSLVRAARRHEIEGHRAAPQLEGPDLLGGVLVHRLPVVHHVLERGRLPGGLVLRARPRKLGRASGCSARRRRRSPSWRSRLARSPRRCSFPPATG